MKIIVRKPTAAEIKTAQAWPVWTKEPSNFKWHYDERETCLIFEGDVLVKAGSETVNFKAGDLVIFPEGLDCEWHIAGAVKKHYNFG